MKTSSSTETLRERAEQLVRSRILGNRKGMPAAPTYTHSFRVAEKLQQYGSSEDVRLAGLLHDVVEDGGVSFAELDAMEFPGRVIDLVRLCSHDATITHKDSRWMFMVANLVRADDADAWAIKLADVLDNLGDAHAMTPDRELWMRQVKAPLLVCLSEQRCGTSGIWNELRLTIGAAYPFT